MLDTHHFLQNCTDRLLASFDNLDETTDGSLVHSENWQTLNLLQEKYRERGKCIDIDPLDLVQCGTSSSTMYRD